MKSFSKKIKLFLDFINNPPNSEPRKIKTIDYLVLPIWGLSNVIWSKLYHKQIIESIILFDIGILLLCLLLGVFYLFRKVCWFRRWFFGVEAQIVSIGFFVLALYFLIFYL